VVINACGPFVENDNIVMQSFGRKLLTPYRYEDIE
jgi:hypothetical protein